MCQFLERHRRGLLLPAPLIVRLRYDVVPKRRGSRCLQQRGVKHRTMRLISLCVAVFAAEIQSEQDMSECLSIYA